MRKIPQLDKDDKKLEKQESFKLGSSGAPFSPASFNNPTQDIPLLGSVYGTLVDGIQIPDFNPEDIGPFESPNDHLLWSKTMNYRKSKIIHTSRTTKEIAADLIKKAEGILPESKQRKALFKKERVARKGETLEERIDREKKIKRRDLNKAVRIKATKQRRKEFNLKRPQLILKMLANDMLYECAVDGCKDKNITVDHITPLSLGGGDEVENLQFLCLIHNSKKGIK